MCFPVLDVAQQDLGNSRRWVGARAPGIDDHIAFENRRMQVIR